MPECSADALDNASSDLLAFEGLSERTQVTLNLRTMTKILNCQGGRLEVWVVGTAISIPEVVVSRHFEITIARSS